MTLTYTVAIDDHHGGVTPQTFVVTVRGTNDAPVLALNNSGLVSALQQIPVTLAPALTLSDIDSTTLTAAKIQITGNYSNGEDVLSFTDTSKIHGSWDAATGTLTLTAISGQAPTDADFQAALSTVTYTDTSGSPSTVDRTVTFTVRDPDGTANGGVDTATATAIIHVTPVSLAITAIANDTGASSLDFITSDTTLVVSGTNGALAPGEKVQVSSDGTNWFDVTQSTGSSWSYDDTTNPHLSDVTYQVRVIDAANNISKTASRLVIVDATAPSETFPTVTLTSDTGSSGTDFITSNGGVHFAGAVADTGGAGIGTVQVFNGATLLGTASVSAGNWSLDTILAAGTYNALKVTVTDLAGNSNTTTNAQTIIVDATAPSETFPTVTLTSDTGSSGTDFITSNGGVHFAGAVADTGGAGIGTVQVFNGATLLGTASVSAGNWSLDTILAAGTYNALKVTVTDLAGNSNTTTNAQTIIVDATAPSETFPTVTLTSDTGSSGTDFITSNGGVHFAGAVADTGGAGIGTVQVFNGATLLGTASVSAGNWSLDTILAAGTYNALKVTVTDLAGNSNTTTNAQTIIVDATAPSETFPTVTLTSDTGSSGTDFITSNGGVHFAGAVADTGGAGIGTVQVFNGATLLGTASVSAGNWSLDTILAAGTYNALKVTVTDLAGNSNTTTNAQTIIVDATAPSETFPTVTLTSDTGSSGTDFITSNGGVHFAGAVADTGGAGIGTVQVFNGATLLGTASVSAGNWSLDTILAAGTYNALKVTVTDLAGNSNTTTNAQTIIVDATAPSETFPTVTLTSDTGSSGTDFITSNGGVHFAGAVADTGGAGIGTVQVFNGATLLGTASVSAGNWSLDTILAAGTYNALKVTVTDLAGNSNTTTNAQTIIVDATAPSETFPTVTLTSDTGSSGTDFITSNGGVHFAGAVADTGGAGIGTVQVFNGATLLGTASVSAGNWSLDTILAAGTYNALKVTVTDLAGNSNTTTNAQTIIVDATAPSETFPTVTLTSDTGSSGTDFITSNGGVHFAGAVADTGGAGIGTVQVFNGATLLGTASVSAGNWSLDTILAAGTYNALKVTVTDLAGNSNTTTNAQTIIVDATAPSAVATVTALSADTGTCRGLHHQCGVADGQRHVHGRARRR